MRSVELFVGAGGMGIGVSRAGFKPVAVMDKDGRACQTLRENQARGLKPVMRWPIYESDVRDFDYFSIEGDVELVTGGPPCQPFSLGGRHLADLDDRDMFPQAVRAVRDLKPRAFIFENVKGLTRANFVEYIDYVYHQLTYPKFVARRNESWFEHLARLKKHRTRGTKTELRYKVFRKVLNSADYGVPQKRERVFFVGFRSDIDPSWTFPKPTHSRDALLWSQWRSGVYWDLHKVAKKNRPEGSSSEALALKLTEEPKLKGWQTVRDAFSDLPDPEFHPRKALKFLNHRFQPGARMYRGHTGSPLDDPAKTLKAGVNGVPGGENMLRRSDGSVRYFTIRESARIQTFPDDMAFNGVWTQAMRQIGNAVPVELARIVAASVHTTLRMAA